MSRILVWDLPTRLFHWLLAAGFAAAFAIAILASDEHPLFPFHAILGLVLAFMVVLRVLWGFVGTRHARFRSFLFGPVSVLGYLKRVMTTRGARYVGHNPGSSYAIFAMLALVLGTVISGALRQTGSEAAEELHELFAYCTIAVAAAHVAGVLLHTVQQRENITLSMFSGLKEGEPSDAIPSARPVAGVVFLLFTLLWAGGLVRNYDRAAQRTILPVVGVAVQLKEAEQAEPRHGEHREHEKDD